jgi:hypothetical protein
MSVTMLDETTKTPTSETVIPLANVLKAVNSELASLKDVPDTNFRLQNLQIHLTYKGHLETQALLSFLESIKPIKQYSIVRETGDTEYAHTHVLIKFEKQFQSRNSRIFDFSGVHPHIKTVTSATHWNNTVKYHRKQGIPDTNIPEVVETKVNFVQKIWDSPSLAEALMENAKRPGDVNGIIALFPLRPNKYGEEPDVEWQPWQKELLDEISVPCKNKTQVIWYHDEEGGAGKTFLAKHLGKYHPATFFSTKASAYHVATMLAKFLEANRNHIALAIFNFTRQQEDHKIYECLESIKDGAMTAVKYVGESMFFESPHVVVFANYMPAIKKMTLSRWDIRQLQAEVIEGSKVITVKRLDVDELIRKENAKSVEVAKLMPVAPKITATAVINTSNAKTPIIVMPQHNITPKIQVAVPKRTTIPTPKVIVVPKRVAQTN